MLLAILTSFIATVNEWTPTHTHIHALTRRTGKSWICVCVCVDSQIINFIVCNYIFLLYLESLEPELRVHWDRHVQPAEIWSLRFVIKQHRTHARALSHFISNPIEEYCRIIFGEFSQSSNKLKRAKITTYLAQCDPRIKPIHKIIHIDIQLWIHGVYPFGQIFAHRIQILLGTFERPIWTGFQ